MASVHSDGGASLMAHRSFVAFWLARTCSGFGFQMLSIVVGWQIYALTHSAFYLGLIGLVQFLPSITLALWAGHIADQRDRRRVVLIGLLVEWLAIAALAAATVAHLADVKIILGLIFIISVAKVMEAPSLQSMLPALVPPALLARATAASAVSSQAAMIMGPALGGLLYVFGAQVVYALTAVLYLISVVMVSRLRYEQAPPARQPASLATLFAGVKFIRERPDVLGVISLDLFAVLLGGATALLPIYAHDILHTGPWGLGLLRAAPAVGALLVGFWLSRRSLEKHVGMIMFLSV
ncbi:MFS transporter, partial [Cronobacter sakazakii]|uniref:MFS transporter n=1 Tax=Cronobacter sakazakii TaxID=28141 RepID=UPI0020CAC955